jgi:hypothetical protein
MKVWNSQSLVGLVALVAVATVVGCSNTAPTPPAAGTTDPSHGMMPESMAKDPGMMQDGMAKDGMAKDGMMKDDPAKDGMAKDAMMKDGGKMKDEEMTKDAPK